MSRRTSGSFGASPDATGKSSPKSRRAWGSFERLHGDYGELFPALQKAGEKLDQGDETLGTSVTILL